MLSGSTLTPDALAIAIPQDAIQDFCRKWTVTEFSLFGSVTTHQFDDQSDIDVLLQVQDSWALPWHYLIDMRDELVSLFGREVHIVERPWLERSSNPFRKNKILQSAVLIYAQ
jgi:uncharacterized protein